MSIPAGYQLHITSWTNDADNYKTTIHDGLSEEDVKFLLDVVKPFKSHHNGGRFGNDDSCTSQINEHILECLKKYPTTQFQEYLEGFETDIDPDEDEEEIDGLSDLAYDLVGRDEYCGWRVFESAKIFFYPEEVKEVTKQFI